MENEVVLGPESALLPLIRRALSAPRPGAYLDQKIRSAYRLLAASRPGGESDREGVIQELAARLSHVLAAAAGCGQDVRRPPAETVRM